MQSSQPHRTAFIGVGSNLGDRVQNIIDARCRIENFKPVICVTCSSFYVSSPVGYTDQNDFVNCVFQVTTKSDAASLFSEMQKIETELGRVRDINNQNGPRTLDLDLLLFEKEIMHEADLTIPHPRLQERLFVVEPLLELAPTLEIPQLGPLSQLLHAGMRNGAFAGQVIHRLGQ